MCFWKECYEKMQKFPILKIWVRPLFEIREYAFNVKRYWHFISLHLVDYFTDIAPGAAASFSVWTNPNEADDFDLNYQCEAFRYICVTLEKGDAPVPDFKMEPATFTSCKVLDGCDGECLCVKKGKIWIQVDLFEWNFHAFQEYNPM